jgi:2-polyprenyl-6-methoxyphenol hydroxylase-like FAD-dependent oxidoreductase
VPANGHRTIAMVGVWVRDEFDLPDPTHTLIESYDGGWAWSVPISMRERYVAAMVDPRTSALARAAAPIDTYLAEIRKAERLSGILQGATLVDGPRGWDASMYYSRRYVDDNILLVGDAASFIDPLSSAGVKKALASGWLAAVATHTSLQHPNLRDVAMDFYAAREREVYESFRAMTEHYWRDAAAGHAHPFWTDRAVESDSVSPEQSRVAFEQLRRAAVLRVEVAPDLKVEARPAVSGAEIIMQERLVRGDDDAGVRFAFDVDMLALVRLAPAYTSVPDLLEAYNARHAPVDLPNFLAALATALGHQWLRWCDTN